jgi:prephenate dehydrogenase
MIKEGENTQPVVGIIGLGLIGGSIAKDLREAEQPMHIVAYDPRDKSIESAIKSGHINDSLPVSEIAKIATTMVIAAPIDQVGPIGLEIRDSLKNHNDVTQDKKLVLDVASVKKPISNIFSVLNTTSVEFVATHPMAGTEFSGFSHARKGLFRAKPWIISPHENNSDEAINRTKEFLEQFGPHIRIMDADVHDRHAAVVSHSIITLSNLIFDFIAERHPEALDLAGDGFSSTTRLASGNAEMHASIVRANKGFVYQYLDEFRDYIDTRIDELQVEKDILPFFESNVQRRNDWLRNRKSL